MCLGLMWLCLNRSALHVASNSAAFQGGEWSEMAYNSPVPFTGCGGEVCSVLKPLQPDLRLIFHVCNPAKSPAALPASSRRSLVCPSHCWDMAYKTGLWDFPLNAVVSADSCSFQTSCEVAPFSTPLPATVVVVVCISRTPLSCLHQGFAPVCSLLWLFGFSVTSRC